MNKVYFMSFVLAAALPAMAVEEQYRPLFTGVGDGELINNGGTWVKPEDATVATTNDTAVAFETADNTPIGLNVTADAADTNTIVKVELQVTLADVGKCADLSSGAAQTAFCVCTNSFNAWNGSDWVALNEVPAGIDESQPTNLTVEISYQDMKAESPVRKARFTVGDTILVTRDGSSPWVNLGASAIATNNLAGFAINGEGIIAKADASVMLGVAEYAGVKYGTISNAVEVAKDAGGDTPTVKVLRETTEDVTEYAKTVNIAAADDVPVKVNPTGNVTPTTGESAPAAAGANGEYTASLPASIATHVSAKNLQITLPYTNKEVKPNSVKIEGTTATFEVRTASSVLREASVDEGKHLTANVEGLHEYLAAHAASDYASKDVSSSTISVALAATRGGENENGLPLYQSYALGIAPTDSVKPVTVASDTNPDAITVAIPSLNNVATSKSGDYNNIKYVVKKGEEVISRDTDAGNPISLPLSTGSYTIIINMQ